MFRKLPFAQFTITLIIVAGFMYTLWALTKNLIPPDNKETALVLIGILGAAFKDVVGYWFGSTSSSKAKDDIIANSQPINKGE